MTGLAMTPAVPDDGPPPVTPGPTFALSEGRALATVRGEIDRDGGARVFAALSEGKGWSVHLLEVRGGTVTDRGAVLRRRGKEPSVDLAAQGLARWEPVLEGTVWETRKPGGRSKREMAPQFAFTAHREGLVRAQMMGVGPHAGSAWPQAGGAGSAATAGYGAERLGIIRQIHGTVDRFILPDEDGAPTLAARVAVDGSGTVHVLYELDERRDALRYARIPGGDFRPVKLFESAWKKPPETTGDPPASIGEDASLRVVDALALAVDPDAQLAMVATIRSRPDAGRVFTRAISRGVVGKAVPIGGEADGVLLAAAGDRGFHALIHDRAPEGGDQDRILYLAWRGRAWSRPVLLGSGDAVSALLADRSGRALAIWHRDGGLAARWVSPGGDASGQADPGRAQVPGPS